MSALPNDLALTTITDGSEIVASDHRNNYTAIQAAVNALRDALAGGTANEIVTVVDSTHLALALLVNANIDAAAAIAYSKLSLTGHIVNADLSGSAAITLAKLAASLAAAAQTTPANPTGTASATAKMMGLSSGTTIVTPNSTRLFISVTGDITPGAGTACPVHLRYGTGNGPANAAATTGTVVGNTGGHQPVIAANAVVPFTLTGIVTGLTPATAVWIDVDLASSGGGNTAAITNLTINAFDLI